MTLVSVIIGGLAAVYAADAPELVTYATLGGEVVTITDGLVPESQGIRVEESELAARGDTLEGVVQMTASGSLANEATTLGHFLYVYRLEVAEVDPGQLYRVDCYQDGLRQTRLYVQQSASPRVGDSVTLTWHLGPTLSSSVFEVQVREVSESEAAEGL